MDIYPACEIMTHMSGSSWTDVHHKITVADFVRECNGVIDLEWEANAEYAKGRPIREMALNRPGLALAGFTRYFANHRIQVFGLAELTYLHSLPQATRVTRLLALVKRTTIPAIVLTRGRRLPDYLGDYIYKSKIPVLRTSLVTGHFINAATVLLQNMTAPTMRAAGTMLVIQGVGVLLEGSPGIGKSEIALALIERGHSLVADDTTILKRSSNGEIIAEASSITKDHMEIRGLGIIHVPSIFGVGSVSGPMRLDLIIHMKQQERGEELDRTGLNQKTRNVLGTEIPLITVPVAAGRDLTHVVEVAALNQRLRAMGRDAALELDEKLKSLYSTRPAT